LAFIGQSKENMKLKVSELFYSAQGEGRFVGVPSVFLRTFGCNFTCSGFGCAPGTKSTEAEEVAKNVHLYKDFNSLPLVTTGCDSYASWHPAFKELSPTIETGELVDRLLALTPNHRWVQDNGNDVHLVITGGEPLLGWQRVYEELLSQQRMQDLENLTFETNGTQNLQPRFADYLDAWNNAGREITFSISPKLSASGEEWADAICPDVVAEYQEHGTAYLKFVVDSEHHFDEVDQAVLEYRGQGFAGKVFVMPQGGVVTPYAENRVRVADWALTRGYNYSPRLHVDLWGNGWGK
jgi:organic radical activating enzyme